MTDRLDAASKPLLFSILIGLVSTEDRARILETLAALRKQQGAHAYEVIIGDRRNDEISRKIQQSHPEALLIPCAPDVGLPELRTAALDRARGQYVIVTEDHCLPSSDWLDSIAQAFRTGPPATVAVGGCVENGANDTALDWATFFCEYSQFLAPVSEGVCTVLPGMNVAYDRSALRNLDRSLLTGGFWETTAHPVLLAAGRLLYSTNSIRLVHCKKFSFGLFARQRFIYSRYYAGRRFGEGQWMWRALAIAATPILPVLLLGRIVRQVGSKAQHRTELISALPWLAVFVLIWALGETVGYALGPGNALRKIE